VLDINLQIDPLDDHERRPQQHEAKERDRPRKGHVDLFAAAQQGAVWSEQRQKTERGCAEERQPDARNLRGGLVPRLVIGDVVDGETVNGCGVHRCLQFHFDFFVHH
jgi:hypothetical protein